MKLNTGVGISDDDGFHFVSFYDQEQGYGLTLTRNEGETAVEVMVADQSAYRPDGFKVRLAPGTLTLWLPQGTVDTVDGEDFYEVEYTLDEISYPELADALRRVVADVAGLVVEIAE